MVTFVSADWVAERIDSPDILLLDPRRPMKYLQGHLKNAVNLPVFRAFDAQGKLLPADALAVWIGSAGLGEQTTPVLYDSPEGQNGAMLAWILEYLGRTDVRMLSVFFERWVAEKREVFYKPVEAAAAVFTPRVNRQIRVTLDELRAGPPVKLIDFRSQDEYTGARDLDGKPGHIPGAVNIVWRDLVGPSQTVLAPQEKLAQMLTAAGIARGDQIVAYCRTGPRAALGYLALRQYGYAVRLYDGSYAEWARYGLPVEVQNSLGVRSQKSPESRV
ncbi:MAG: sulfurtransferase [Deltaproteobacteria bacterium]|nr:sulfurtransferase [Deltaproteobacteria bacterium]